MHVLLVHDPEEPNSVFARLRSRRPWSEIGPGELLRVKGRRLRIVQIEPDSELVLHAFTVADNVVTMPRRTASVVADLYRFHAFVERFGCDPDAWLAHLRARGRAAGGDARMARWLRARLRRDPNLVDAIRCLVAATPIDDDDHLAKRTS
jgi:hypothetical protein